MNKYFKVSITLNYGKVIFKAILPLIIGILVLCTFVFLVANEIIAKDFVRFEIAFPIFLVLIGISTFLVVRSSYVIEEVFVNIDCLEAKKIGKIHFDDIKFHKNTIIKGYSSLIIGLNDGKKMAIAPSRNFSSKSEETFTEFIIEFEAKIEWYKLTKEKLNKIQFVERKTNEKSRIY